MTMSLYILLNRQQAFAPSCACFSRAPCPCAIVLMRCPRASGTVLQGWRACLLCALSGLVAAGPPLPPRRKGRPHWKTFPEPPLPPLRLDSAHLSRLRPTVNFHGGAPFNALDHLADLAHMAADFDRQGATRSSWCLDLFGGKLAVSGSYLGHGLEAEAFDLVLSPDHDFTSQKGFQIAFMMMLKLQCGALIMAGPPCSLWVFLQ